VRASVSEFPYSGDAVPIGMGGRGGSPVGAQHIGESLEGGERTKAAIAERRKFSAVLKMLRAG
jgi:hypothetical protein